MKRILMAGLLALSLAPATLLAHGFHYQITVDTSLVTDSQGRLTGLQMHWLQDADVSRAMFEDEDMSPENRSQTIRQVGDRLIHDLQPLNYFTHLKLDGRALQTSAVTTHSLTLDNNQQMVLDFTLPLQTPVMLTGKTLSWTMQDPEGIGILRYTDATHISQPANCKAQLISPPAAATLDEQAQQPQTITLSCS